jgi:hypothetical protein
MKTIKASVGTLYLGSPPQSSKKWLLCKIRLCRGKTVHESLQWDDSKFLLRQIVCWDKCPDQINMDCRSNKPNETQEEASD